MASRACSIVLYELLDLNEHRLNLLRKTLGGHEHEQPCTVCVLDMEHRYLRQGLLLLIHRLGCQRQWLPGLITPIERSWGLQEAQVEVVRYAITEPDTSPDALPYLTVWERLCQMTGTRPEPSTLTAV